MSEKMFENIFESEFYQEKFEAAKATLKNADSELIVLYIAMNRALLLYCIKAFSEIAVKSEVLEKKLAAFMKVQKEMVKTFESVLTAKSGFDQQVRDIVDLILKEKGIDRGQMH